MLDNFNCSFDFHSFLFILHHKHRQYSNNRERGNQQQQQQQNKYPFLCWLENKNLLYKTWVQLSQF